MELLCDIVGILGLGPIGLMCARWYQIVGAGKILGIDNIPEQRLDQAKTDYKFQDEDVCKAIRDRLQCQSGADVGIECAGFDHPQSWIYKVGMKLGLETDTSEILQEMVQSVQKAENILILGIYTGYANHFPIGEIIEKSITI
uniref:Uncharacterized protein n=1 Tax=Panagrolaimus davidi TaxID=227884 RepID=A0A914PZV5_9BILA